MCVCVGVGEQLWLVLAQEVGRLQSECVGVSVCVCVGVFVYGSVCV